MAIESQNPYSHEKYQSYDALSESAIEQALAESLAVYSEWSQSTFAVRAIHVLSLSDLMKEKREKLARLISMEMGKNIKESRAEIDKCILCCDFYADNADMFLKRSRLVVPEGLAYQEYHPLGPILAIMPWNFPFWQVFRFAIPCVMAGNVGVLKHASNVPQCALAIMALFNEAGFPKGVINTLLINNEQVEAVIADNRIKAVTLTGSEFAGSAVAAAAGKHIKKTVLELGGSDPFIVLKDADIEKAAQTGAYSRLINSGQSCIAAKRFIIDKSIQIPFLDKFITAFRGFKFGDPFDENCDFGPMARQDLVKQVDKQVQDSVKMGAKVVIGGQISEKHAGFYEPTILVDVHPEMPVCKEEVFGPVAAVFFADNEEEMVKLANTSKYGLGASIWSKDIVKAEKMATEIDSGAVYINKMMMSHPAVPFGGIKLSGFGRELSEQGILEFVNHKTIWRS